MYMYIKASLYIVRKWAWTFTKASHISICKNFYNINFNVFVLIKNHLYTVYSHLVNAAKSQVLNVKIKTVYFGGHP